MAGKKRTDIVVMPVGRAPKSWAVSKQVLRDAAKARGVTVDTDDREPLKLAGPFIGDANGRNDRPIDKPLSPQQRAWITIRAKRAAAKEGKS